MIALMDWTVLPLNVIVCREGPERSWWKLNGVRGGANPTGPVEVYFHRAGLGRTGRRQRLSTPGSQVPGSQPCRHLGFGCLVFWTVRRYFPVFKLLFCDGLFRVLSWDSPGVVLTPPSRPGRAFLIQVPRLPPPRGRVFLPGVPFPPLSELGPPNPLWVHFPTVWVDPAPAPLPAPGGLGRHGAWTAFPHRMLEPSPPSLTWAHGSVHGHRLWPWKPLPN